MYIYIYIYIYISRWHLSRISCSLRVSPRRAHRPAIRDISEFRTLPNSELEEWLECGHVPAEYNTLAHQKVHYRRTSLIRIAPP